MQVAAADERDIDWEESDPLLRVVVFTPRPVGKTTSWTTSTFDCRDGDVLEVILWAQQHVSPGDVFAIGLLHRNGTTGNRGLTWVLGGDPNASRPPGDTAAFKAWRWAGKKVTVVDASREQR